MTPYVCIAETDRGRVRFRCRASGPAEARRVSERYAYIALRVVNPYRNVIVFPLAAHGDGA